MAVVVCHFTTEWGMYTFQIQIPDFMAQILQFDIAAVSIQKSGAAEAYQAVN